LVYAHPVRLVGYFEQRQWFVCDFDAPVRLTRDSSTDLFEF